MANSSGGIEVCSSEEMLSEIDSVNKYLLETSKQCDHKTRLKINNLLLIGADAIALYPSLRKEQTADVVCEEFMG